MKIRQGFVSNSSSASYIVTITAPYATQDDLLRDIYATCSSAMEELEGEYFRRQEEYRQEDLRRSNIETRVQQFVGLFGDRELRPRIFTAEDDSLPPLLDADSCAEPTRLFLGFDGISLGVDDKGRHTLTSFTSMHNSFMSVHRLLSTIYFEFLTNFGGATFKFEEDTY